MCIVSNSTGITGATPLALGRRPLCQAKAYFVYGTKLLTVATYIANHVHFLCRLRGRRARGLAVGVRGSHCLANLDKVRPGQKPLRETGKAPGQSPTLTTTALRETGKAPGQSPTWTKSAKGDGQGTWTKSELDKFR
jgi:hypothetical protein